ncbi:MAG: hypothetical protein M3O70_21975 [Actinomycetota bacterium]|nr:hypothetical protein [Actinomycetota bacterium]
MRSAALEALDVLVGEWSLTLTDAWFLESREVRQNGHAVVRWIGDAFIELEAEMEGEPVWHFVFGRSDANKRLIALYHDPRPTSRVVHMTFGNGEWTLLRQDPDFPTSTSVSSLPSRTIVSAGAGRHPRMPALPGARTST